MKKSLLFGFFFSVLTAFLCSLLCTSCFGTTPKERRNEAEKGWDSLYAFKKDGDVSKLSDARRSFSAALNENSENRLALWGMGIVKTEEAQLESKSPEDVEQCLKHAERYLKAALAADSLSPDGSDPAATEKDKKQIEMDLSNVFIGFGAFYQQTGKTDLSQKALKESSAILEKLLSSDPDNANACQMMSFTAFYQQKYEQAKAYCEKAEALGASFSPAYKADLEKALNH